MAENDLSERQDKALPRRKPRSVSRLLQNVSAFEKLPERMWWVGQTTMRESVGLKKVTKLVVDRGLGDWPNAKKRDPHEENKYSQSDPT